MSEKELIDEITRLRSIVEFKDELYEKVLAQLICQDKLINRLLTERSMSNEEREEDRKS